jgi:hypothetical protein
MANIAMAGRHWPRNTLKPQNQMLNMEKKDWKTWLRRIGTAGFLFFLLKGLLWLAILGGLLKGGCN